LERFRGVGHDQDGFFCESFLEFVEGFLSFWGPLKLLVFLKKFVHWSGDV